MRQHQQQPTPCQSIDLLGVSVVVKRDDLNHPVIQGNKLRKLKYNIKAAQSAQAQTLITFGGAYSNHLLATAFAAKQAGLKALGFVRGDELAETTSKWSSTLNHCHQLGMQLEFVSRSDYRLKQAAPAIAETINSLSESYVIPEGGSNQLAVKGVAEMVTELAAQTPEPTHIICPVGTGGTVAGLVQGVVQNNWQCQVIGVAVLKGLQEMENTINQWLGSNEIDHGYQVLHEFSGGGYAKNSQELIGFSLGFEQITGIPLDKVYNSKSFYALAQLIKNQQITSEDRPLIIHTGGLQGGTNQAKDLR
ncbi:pyridoxal-phosphate dependent enzyme [Marinicella sp. S1101]|uniref:1-aminocyclopropane-1-carboxylate deaminase/D-cysteine desulfhydrase n=1 Tax=Marinicella marina TaxID=2996016 RepID=UPI002260B875|nr:pyridoxal-phosphate dependent enzyme [Marinicella marina]MCX7553197.1 pyridoxal-phosphate dependent enzyme [Marinicella marina]MDJ1138929.1 pyridoxal-phosphate dependent enzyme [Marinicella marina]